MRFIRLKLRMQCEHSGCQVTLIHVNAPASSGPFPVVFAGNQAQRFESENIMYVQFIYECCRVRPVASIFAIQIQVKK